MELRMVYTALHIGAQTERLHFHAKTTSAKLYIYNGEGARDLYIDEAHTALDIFRFAAFFLFGSIGGIRFNCIVFQLKP